MITSDKSIISTEQFLNEIHGPNTTIYWNVGGKSWKNKPQTYEHARPTLQWLNNEKQKDIYFIVNSGGTKDNQITRINSVFIDWDAGRDENNKYFSDQIVCEKKQHFLPKINKFPLKPSFVIETRNGYQVYWLMYPGVSNNQFVQLQKRLSSYFMSDNKVTNPARAMRLPNYYWIKPNSNCTSFFVHILWHNSTRYYYDTLCEVLPSLPMEEIKEDDNNRNSKKRTHNNTKINGNNTLNIIVGPIVHSDEKKVVLGNMNEVVDYLQQQDIAEYLNVKKSQESSNKGVNIYCPFHKEVNPSASIYFGQNNHYMLKCHSSNCSFGQGSIIQVVQNLEGVEENEAITLLMKHYNLEIDESWKDKYKEMLEKNITVIDNLPDMKEKYPNLFRCINRIKNDVISKVQFAQEHISLRTSDGKPIFFCSLRKFEEISKGNCYGSCHGGQNLKVDRYCLLGLMEKIAEEDIPKGLLTNAREVQESRGLPYRVQFYFIPEYTEDLLQKAEDIAQALKNHGVRMKGISRALVLGIFGKEVAKRIYPQFSNKQNENGDKFKLKVEFIVLNHIEGRGYSRISDIVAEIVNDYDWHNVADRRVRRCLPLLRMQHDLTEITANKELKHKYGIESKGYPRIIVPKDGQV